MCVVLCRKKTVFLFKPIAQKKTKRDKEGLFFKEPFIIEMMRKMLNDAQVKSGMELYNINAPLFKSLTFLDTFYVYH